MSATDKQLLELLGVRASAGYDTSPACFTNLQRAVEAGQTHVICNDHQRSVGYIVWAELSKESFGCLLVEGILPRYAYGWKEGRFIAVVDVAFQKGCGSLLRSAMIRLLGRRRIIAFVRCGRLSVYLQRDGKFSLLLRRRFSPQSEACASWRSA